MHGLGEFHALRDRAEQTKPKAGDRFMGGLDCGTIQFDPATVGKFHEAACGTLQPLQIRLRKLQSFGLPRRGHGKPVNSTALDEKFWTNLARGKEQSVEGGIAEILGLLRTFRPCCREGIEKVLVRVANPQARLRSKPIQPTEPVSGRFEASVVQNFRLFCTTRRAWSRPALPFVAVPLPSALVKLAAGQQPKTNRIVAQFKNKLRLGRMR